MTEGRERAGQAERAGGDEDDIVDLLLGRPRGFTRLDAIDGAGVPADLARSFWLALGFPATDDTDQGFTEADIAAISAVHSLLQRGLIDLPLALSMTRGLGRAVERFVSWQVSVALEVVLEQEGLRTHHPVDDLARAIAAGPGDAGDTSRRPTPETAERVGHMLLELSDDLAPLMLYAWRRHLAATIGQLRTEAEGEGARGQGQTRSVGFADMVGFTVLVNHLSERQLASLVMGFEELAATIVVAHGGRIIKTLGDEVVYVTERPGPAAAIAVDLLEGMERDPSMPQLRIGIATGPVLSHLGDVFGTTVNRASRLCDVARPDSVVIDDQSSSVLTNVSGFAMSRMQPRVLRGLGLTSVWNLRRSSGTGRRGPQR